MKVMFICTGNICRSAMAEGIFRKLIQDDQREKEIEVYSCGIFAETGDYATSNSIEAVKKYRVDLCKHRATNIQDSQIEKMDLILCATLSHKQHVLYRYPALEGKVYTIKEYAQTDKTEGKDIQDPWGYDYATYCSCAEEIEKNLQMIYKKIIEDIDKKEEND